MAFLASFLQYVVIFVFMVVVAAAGIFVGKIFRDRQDKKNMNEQ